MTAPAQSGCCDCRSIDIGSVSRIRLAGRVLAAWEYFPGTAADDFRWLWAALSPGRLARSPSRSAQHFVDEKKCQYQVSRQCCKERHLVSRPAETSSYSDLTAHGVSAKQEVCKDFIRILPAYGGYVTDSCVRDSADCR